MYAGYNNQHNQPMLNLEIFCSQIITVQWTPDNSNLVLT